QRLQDPGFTLDLNIKAKIPSRGMISGRGLTSEWKGDVHVTGNTEVYKVHANLSSLKGTFIFSEKQFNLMKGTIECAGDLFQDSRLNLQAKADIEKITAEIILQGS